MMASGFLDKRGNVISGIHPGYLHYWIEANHKRIWPSRTTPPRFLGDRGVEMWGQGEFLNLGRDLVSRLGAAQQEGRGLPIQFEILDLEEVGAWVVWPAQCYGVLFTKGLLWKLQRISWEIQRILPKVRTVPVKNSNFFEELWADLPLDEAHFRYFGALVAHIAFTFIVHHELAHAGLGHEGLYRVRCRARDAQQSDGVADIAPEFMDEFAGAIDAATRDHEFLSSQAVETDADVHGMFYTRRLLLDQAVQIRHRTQEDGGAMHEVWKGLLRDADCVELMLFIGIAVGLLSLLPDLESDRIEQTVCRTHPPLPSRLLLAFHVAGSINGYTKKYWENRSAAITTAIIAIDAFQREELGKGIDKMEVKPTERPDKTVDSSQAGTTKWQSLSHVSIVDAMLRMRELEPYWEDLVSEIRRLTPALAPFARFPDFLRYEWHRAASPNSGTSYS